MRDTRFDKYIGREQDAEFLAGNGLVEQNEDDLKEEQILFNSAMPYSLIWKDTNDFKKIIAWDSDWEKFLDHRIKIINLKGFENWLPWKVHEQLGIKLVNGFALNQAAIGTCAGAGFRNTGVCSDLINTKMANQKTFVEMSFELVYSLARGNGRLNWGSGCNGTGLVKYGTEIGNHWTSDMGPYTTRGSMVTQANLNNPEFKKRALQKQSIVAFLPSVSFDLFFKACSAGFSIWIGSPTYPSGAKKSNGLSVVGGWTNGAHATGFTFGAMIDGEPMLFFQNSHGDRYRGGAGDRFNSPASGTWVSRKDFPMFKITKNYGTPFVHCCELPNV